MIDTTVIPDALSRVRFPADPYLSGVPIVVQRAVQSLGVPQIDVPIALGGGVRYGGPGNAR